MVDVTLVRTLRDQTGAGIMDCKQALENSGGDIEKAAQALREKGVASATKRVGRETNEGVIETYLHTGGRVGAMVELGCETDFVARTDQFQEFVKDLAMQVAAANPICVSRENISDQDLAREREVYKAQARETGKPENVLDKIVEGKIGKFYRDVVLMEQAFIKDSDQDIQTLVNAKIAELGEKISIRRFTRYHVGEGLDREEKDLSQEVKELIANV